MFANGACTHILHSSKFDISGIPEFSLSCLWQKGSNQHGNTVFRQFMFITFPICKVTQLVISEIRYLASILEPVMISTVCTLLEIARWICPTEQ